MLIEFVFNERLPYFKNDVNRYRETERVEEIERIKREI